MASAGIERGEPAAAAQRVRGAPRFRYAVISALWVAGMFLYLDRVNISMAAPYIIKELGLSGVEMGAILSVFFWGYILGQLAGGVASDRFNIRRWVSVLYLSWCVLTAATGLCRTVLQFSAIRFVFGFAEGAVANATTKLQNHWVLPHERGRANGAQIGSAYLGLVVGMPLVGWLVTVSDWRVMFYVTGALTLIGVAVFLALVYDHPRDHPRISEAEKWFIEDALARDRVTYDPTRGNAEPLPFAQGLARLARNWAFWCMCAAYFFVAGVYFTNFSWLPGYLVMERGLTGLQSGNALALPYLAAALGALSGGYLGDRMGSRCGVIIASVAITIPAIFGIVMTQDPWMLIAALCAMLFFNAAAVNLFIVVLFDTIPAEVAGVALAIMAGTFGAFGGVVGPIMMGYAYDQSGSFLPGFAGLGAGLVVALAFLAAVFVYERRVKAQKREKTAMAAQHA